MQVICTTTIDKPSDAYRKFAAMKDWHLIVAGDTKTPEDEYKSLDNCTYLSYQDQENMDKELSDLIGPKCVERRNFAMLHGLRMGADIYALIDNDNIPLDNWGKNLVVGKEIDIYTVHCKHYAFEPLTVAGGDYCSMYHRGLPVDLVKIRNEQYIKGSNEKTKIDVEASLWTGSADVDAVHRLFYGDQAYHPHGESVFPFTSNKWGPFNSQNTFFTKDAIKTAYLPEGWARNNDIAMSYVVQSHGFRVAYSYPSVHQDRNEHDVIKDIQDELYSYKNIGPFMKLLQSCRSCAMGKYMTPKALLGYKRWKQLVENL